MRRISCLVGLSAILLSAGCADTARPGLTDPGRTSADPAPQPTHISGSSVCTVKTAAEIEAAITQLYFKNLWPDPNSALGKFSSIQSQLAAGNTLEAQRKTYDLVGFITLKFNQLTPAQQAAAQEDFDHLVADLYCFVGISGQVFDLNPGDPEKAFVLPNGQGGVWFPADFVPAGTLVSLTELPANPSPLVTDLDQYPTYILVETFPDLGDLNALNKGLPVVAVCLPATAPQEVVDRALVGHQRAVGATGFEVLNRVPIPTLLESQLQCPDGLANGPGSVMDRVLSRLADLVLPSRLMAKRAMFLRAGAGGSPEEFSPFGAVDSELLAKGGAGGSPEEFAPPMPGPASSPAATNPPLPGSLVQGTVGTQVTSGLPQVTVQTQGLDGDVNPIAGVTVIFSVQGANQFSPAGNASLCAVDGVTPPTVSVVTDAAGAASLPCLALGTAAGYSNIKARFDPSSLPIGQQVAGLVLVTAEGDSPDNSVNFLVKANAGDPHTISIVEGDNASAAAYSAVSPPLPKVLVTDVFGNAVPGATVNWEPSYVELVTPPLSLPSTSTVTDAEGTTTVASWVLGPGANTLLAELAATVAVGGVQSVIFNGTGTFSAALANACATGGAKDDITKYGFWVPSEKQRPVIQVGLNLSSNGSPGSSENYEITLTATRGTSTWVSKQRLQSGSNSSKGVERLLLFDFSRTPIPAASTGRITFRMSVSDVSSGTPQPMPANRSINMNVGGCAAGSKNCKPVTVSPAGKCDVTEQQLNPFVDAYRRGLAARIYIAQ